MKLSETVLEGLANMVVGDHPLFPYRSSSRITRFFQRCGFSYVHDGTTRSRWAKDRLAELNLGPSYAADLPSDDLSRIISELFDPDDFEKDQKQLEPALEALNKLLKRSGLVAYFDATGRCYLRNTGTGVTSSTIPQQPRPLSQEEIAQRQKLVAFLDSANEDDFTSRLLVPFFQRLGFHRVSPTGHKEKALEFGKDLWMKYQLPTGHWLYFCAQVKRGKIDASGAGGGSNVSTVLAQTKMAMDHPIFDPDANRNVLLDHVFVISAGEITRAARTWLVGHLDASQRRHIIFMDRDEFLDHSARILLDLQVQNTASIDLDDDIPF
jgi:hypothetical protein